MREKASMQNNVTSDERLKIFLKSQVRQNLLSVGRKLVIEKGAGFLTARKLSEASNCSVGTIYNQFINMENFIEEENAQTLDELYEAMQKVLPASSAYLNVNRYVDVFSDFVIVNANLWGLLFSTHLQSKGNLPLSYCKKIRRIEKMLEQQLDLMFGKLVYAEKRLAAQVMEMALFALSGFVATNSLDNLRLVNKQNICKLLLNTYLAGLASLKKG